jgi:hypothetical protein
MPLADGVGDYATLTLRRPIRNAMKPGFDGVRTPEPRATAIRDMKNAGPRSWNVSGT